MTPDELRARSDLGRLLYAANHDELVADGMQPETASRLAWRLARAAVLRLLGFEQTEIPELLGVSKRTGDADLARWRSAFDSGALARAAARDLPPLPEPPDRIEVPSPPRLRRAA